MKAILVLLWICAACTSSDDSRPRAIVASDATTLDAAVGDGGAIRTDPNCGAFDSRPLPLPGWWGQARRQEPDPSSLHDGFVGPYEFYAECYQPYVAVGACSDLIGKSFCYGGRMTLACDSDATCPELTRCSWGHLVGSRPEGRTDFGTCEKTCESDEDCPYTTLHCDYEIGVCSDHLPGDPNIHDHDDQSPDEDRHAAKRGSQGDLSTLKHPRAHGKPRSGRSAPH